VGREGPGVQDPQGTVFALRADRRDGHGIAAWPWPAASPRPSRDG
jgi:hypothetical protein